jgi:hypothetical protein
MKTTTRISACLIAVIAMQSPAMAVILHCPATITVTQTATGTPANWTANNSQQSHHLIGAGFTDGPPKEMGFLKPDTIRKGKLETNTYIVGGSTAYQNWLDCSYQGTSATLGQPIAAGLKQCVVTYSAQRASQWKLEKIECK